jgi:hypothetical protein
MQLDLTADEVTVLSDVLQGALGALREEIYKSETTDYKESLKRREQVLGGLLSRLGSSPRVSG